MRGLYAIVDVDFLRRAGVSPLAFADAVLSVRPAALQLRAKSEGGRATLALLSALAVLPLGWPHHGDSRVVAQDVDPPEAVERGLRERLDIFDLRDVGLHGQAVFR